MQFNYDKLPQEMKNRLMGFVDITGLTAMIESGTPEGLLEKKVTAKPEYAGYYSLVKGVLIVAVTKEGQVWISSGVSINQGEGGYKTKCVLDSLSPNGFVDNLFKGSLDFIVNVRGGSYQINLFNFMERVSLPCFYNGDICEAA